ncbi:MAG: GNAT family N-acetyltransferase [Rickettsiales bacterium]|nr:GNAT family N-acetyltransferase [Rickettsiales bacterium]
MPDGSDAVSVKVVSKISKLNPAEWDECAGSNLPDGNPSICYAFLHALEESQSVRAETGWQPQHLVVENASGKLIGAVPMYLKSHSMGEYVFDYGWANAYERAGGQYYPKLQASIPFTPVTGPRLLVPPGNGSHTTKATLVAAMIEWTTRNDLSSLHVTFPSKADSDYLEEADFMIRHAHQYHWHNRSYKNFDDFLDSLNSRKRKMIRKERRKVTEANIKIQCLSGDNLTSTAWDAFYQFYTDTYDRKWGYPYLTREFFEIVSHSMPEQIVLIMAYTEGIPIAGALNLKGGNSLFGRNWGCVADYKFLHFETCYYSAIEYAINHGLARVEAGTQGPHKLQRGYEPVQTRSAHWIPNRSFRQAVAQFLEQERAEESREMLYLENETPYRQDMGNS